jgi:type IV secretion system protein VirD4
MSFRVLGSDAPEAIELGRLAHPRDGISNKIRYDGERHVLLFGANGSGKGTRVLLPNLLDMRGARSLIVVDPKGELAAVSAPFRRRVGRVVIVNPFGVLTDRQGFEDMESVGFNPLAALDPSARDFNVNASLLAEAMISVESRQPHWDESARALVTALIMYVTLIARQNGRVPAMAEVRRLLCLPSAAPSNRKGNEFAGAGIPKLAQVMMRSSSDGLRNKASQFTEWNGEIQSIVSTAKRHTECFDDPEIADDMARNGCDFRDLKREPTTVYLVIPPDKMERHGKWLRLALTVALQASMRPREAGEPRVLFMLDEFAALGHMQIIENVWSVVRGYGIQIMPVFQDLNQLKSLYRERWETFVGNAGAIVAFAPNDATTAKWLEDRLGETTRMLRTQSSSTSQSTGRNSGNSTGESSGINNSSTSAGKSAGESSGTSSSNTSNTSPVKVPLMTAHQLRGLLPGYMVVSVAGLAHAAPAYAPPYYHIEQRLNRARVNPYYTPVPRRTALPPSARDFDGGFGETQDTPFAARGARRR